jgi:hypothetical protein
VGHIKKYCSKKAKKKNEDSLKGHALITAAEQKLMTNCDSWVIDSGATDHMTRQMDYFASYDEFEQAIQVRIGDSKFIEAK